MCNIGIVKSLLAPLAIALVVTGCGQREPAVRVGFAQQEIYSVGRIDPDYAVHDTVYAKVLWVDDGRRPFAIVSLDMMEFPATQSAAIRKSIADSLGRDDIGVTVCPSHNHSGLEYDEKTLARRVGSVTRAQLEEIAKQKMIDLNANDLAAACNIIAGTARSMGIEVE